MRFIIKETKRKVNLSLIQIPRFLYLQICNCNLEFLQREKQKCNYFEKKKLSLMEANRPECIVFILNAIWSIPCQIIPIFK